MDKVNILGINITNIDRRELFHKIQEFLQEQRQRYVVTPNPEIILRATSHDEELFYILNKADIAIPDGIALKFGGWLVGKNFIRVTGADLTVEILKLAEEKKYRAAVFIWSRGLSSAEEIKKALAKKFPDLAVYVQAMERDEIVDFTAVNQFTPDLLFCALGAPFQEKFIYHNLARAKSAKIALAVGGSFDFLTGKLQRAPGWLRWLGLEWLCRLIRQPKRWPRIFNATIIFPYKFLLWRFILPHLYRPNVACLLYKKDSDRNCKYQIQNTKYKILIVERVDEPGHWQLPQGGTDRENLLTAGIRELSEEINTNKFKAVQIFKNLYTYSYGPGDKIGKFGVPVRKTRGYKGQRQSLFIAEFTGQDSDIKVNFWEHRNWQWVGVDKFLQTISPFRRQAGEIYLKRFKEILK